jgi:repressor LexA
MKELTKRQKEILSFIAEYKQKNSYPPTFREIAEHYKISVKGAHDHVTALKKKGYIVMADKRPRTIGLLHAIDDEKTDFEKIPIYGVIAAGTPILAEENFDGNILIHKTMLKSAKKNKEYFALKVKGDSMTGAGIFDGDTAIIEKQNTVNNGEIAAAVVDDAYTLKRFYKESARIRLQAENPAYKPIYSRDVKILGRLYKIIRDY